MIVTFVCPSASFPIGGVIALYEFANGLSRRGHQVHLLHGEFLGNRIDSLDEISWFRFEPEIEHHMVEPGQSELPHADIFFGPSDRPELGHPVILVQGIEMMRLDVERDSFRTPCLKICVASWLVDIGRRFGVPPGQSEVVFYGIDHARYRVVTPIDQRPPQVGMLYSSHPAKGWSVGLRAMELAREQVPDLRAVVFGMGEPPGSLPHWIRFVENPPPELLVEQIYNQCRVFVQASHYEGFGFTAVEAMACGAALVTTDNGGSDDYAVAGETALVAPPKDAEGLAAHVVTLLQDDGARIRMATVGQRYVQRFNWDQAAADLEACLVRYLADPTAYQHPPGPEIDLPNTHIDPLTGG